jgi:hypothetical protein
MNVVRSEAVELQLRTALELRDEILTALSLNGLIEPAASDNEIMDASDNPFLHTLRSASEGFIPILTAVAVNKVDRKTSMLGGPFFTCDDYPMPTSISGSLAPIIQLDLQILSAISGKDFGDGLLQFWYDTDWDNDSRDLIRVIPSDVLNTAPMTPFEPTGKILDVIYSPVPEELIFTTARDKVDIITGFESMGLHSQTGYLDIYTDTLTEEQLSSISNLLADFIKLTDLPDKFHLFGSFYPIQYSSPDIGSGQTLVHFPEWASSGNSQLFYCLYENGNMSFDFSESLR